MALFIEFRGRQINYLAKRLVNITSQGLVLGPTRLLLIISVSFSGGKDITFVSDKNPLFALSVSFERPSTPSFFG